MSIEVYCRMSVYAQFLLAFKGGLVAVGFAIAQRAFEGIHARRRTDGCMHSIPADMSAAFHLAAQGEECARDGTKMHGIIIVTSECWQCGHDDTLSKLGFRPFLR